LRIGSDDDDGGSERGSGGAFGCEQRAGLRGFALTINGYGRYGRYVYVDGAERF